MPITASTEVSPLISIIIPTYNRPGALGRSLASISLLAGEKSRLEVIVVDDGSRTSCADIVTEKSSVLRMRFLRQENQGPAAARNLGAAHARGKYLAFLDDDCSLPEDWLGVLAGYLDENVMLGGRTVNMLTENPYSTASQDLVEYLYAYFSGIRQETRFIASNNMIVPAVLFSSIGGFSTRFRKAAAEDRDFCDRWLLAGYGIRYIPEIEVRHWHCLSLWQFARQHFGYGFGANLYHLMRKRRRGISFRPEPLGFYLNLILYPFRRGRAKALRLSMLLSLSQLFNAAGYFWARMYRPGQ